MPRLEHIRLKLEKGLGLLGKPCELAVGWKLVGDEVQRACLSYSLRPALNP